MTALDDLDRFARLVDALRPWLGHVVVVGGWAHRLYRYHPLAQALDYEPLTTLDADVAIRDDLTPAAANIRTRLLECGFEEEFLGDEQHPVTHYRLGAEEQGFYAEFLTPLKGSGYKRGGAPDVTAKVGGVTAQKLRHLELLLIEPWPLAVNSGIGIPLSEPAIVNVPNATSYLAQKLLIFGRRKPDDQAKDLLYIHDTIELFGRSLGDLRALWEGHVKPRLSARAARQLRAVVTRLGSEVTDVTRDAAIMASGRGLTPSILVDVCRAGLPEVFA